MNKSAFKFVFLSLILWGVQASLVAEDSFWAQATFVKGEPQVSRSGSSAIFALERGQVLQAGDTVITAAGSRVSFLLNNGSILVVPPKKKVVLGVKSKTTTPEALKTVAGNLSKTLMSRGGDNPKLKHLGGLRGDERNLALAPSRTRVLVGSTELVWLPKYGTKKYLVTLMGPGDALYEKEVESTTLVIPPSKLEAGQTYWWEVRDPRSRNAISSLGHGSFETLGADEEKAVRTMLAEVRASFLGQDQDSSGDFLCYQIYLEYGLNLEALRTLQVIIAKDGEDSSLLRRRKDLCDEMQIDEKDLQLISAS